MIYFNLCKLVSQPCNNKYKDTFAIESKDGQCTELTDGKVSASLIDPAESPSGLLGVRIERQSAFPCPAESSRPMSFAMEVYCNEKASIVPVNMETMTAEECSYSISMEHISGCAAFNLMPIWRALGLVMIGSGILLSYLGFRATKRFMAFIV